MAKYDVTYSCGHTGTVQLYGKNEDRARKIESYERYSLCPECYKKQKQEENEKLALLCMHTAPYTVALLYLLSQSMQLSLAKLYDLCVLSRIDH